MFIETEIDGNTLIVRLKGELDMHSVPNFKEKIISIMEKKGLINLVLNFKEVTFIDSTGVGAILGRYRSLVDLGGKVILVSLRPQVRRIFDLSGMTKLLSVYRSEISAMEEIRGKGGYNFA